MGDLIGLTPGERDAAAAAIENAVGASKSKLVVDTIVDAVNEHRHRVNQLAEQHGCHR